MNIAFGRVSAIGARAERHLLVLGTIASELHGRRATNVKHAEPAIRALQFAVNHLAPMGLTARLLPQLRCVPGSLIVLAASQVERDGIIDVADLQSARASDLARAYRQSKLANVLFTRALARRIPEHRPTVNGLHVGGRYARAQRIAWTCDLHEPLDAVAMTRPVSDSGKRRIGRSDCRLTGPMNPRQLR